MDLIACLFEPQTTWNHVRKLVEKGEWEKVIIVTTDASKKNAEISKNPYFISISLDQPVNDIITHLVSELKKRNLGFEVGLNMVSGFGKEHMAVLSALLKCGIGVRLVALTKEGVKEL